MKNQSNHCSERSIFSINSSNDTSTVSNNTARQVINNEKQVLYDKSSLNSKELIFSSKSKWSIINVKSKSSKAVGPSSLEKALSSIKHTRIDSFGIPINHFNKKIYRVSFLDQLSSNCKPFAEVIEENDTSNAKQEDNNNNIEKKDNHKDDTLCKCIIC